MAYQKDTYDYSQGGNNTIDVTRVRLSVIENLKEKGLSDKQIQSDDVQSHIDDVTNQIMFGMNERLSYFEEHYGGKIDEIMNTVQSL